MADSLTGIARACVVASTVLVIGCGGSMADGGYFLHASSEWTLVEAADPKVSPVADAEPSLDWYAEYRRGVQDVRLSGHSVKPGQLQSELDGFEFERADLRGAPGVTGRGVDGPNVAAFEAGQSYAVMALSYSLDASQLAAWIEGLEEASEARWLEVGGKIE